MRRTRCHQHTISDHGHAGRLWLLPLLLVVLCHGPQHGNAQWELPSHPVASSSRAGELAVAAAAQAMPASVLLADDRPTAASLQPGEQAMFEFTTSINQRQFHVTVSPCRFDGKLDWQLTRGVGTVVFEHTPSRTFTHHAPSIAANSTEPGAARDRTGPGAAQQPAEGRRRGRRQLPLASDFKHPVENGVSSGDAQTVATNDLPPSEVTHTAHDAPPGKYHLTISNRGAEMAEFTVQLGTRSASATRPILPSQASLVPRSIRPTQVTLEWQSVVSSSPVEYCLEYAIGARLQPTDVMNSICGIRRVMNRQSSATSAAGAGASKRTTRQCTRSTQITVQSLFPEMTYVMNVVARDLASHTESPYRGVVVTMNTEGLALQDGRELSRFTLFPRSKQVFTFDVAGRVSANQLATLQQRNTPLRISVVPCHGRVIWDVTRDGLPSQYIAPHYFDPSASPDENLASQPRPPQTGGSEEDHDQTLLGAQASIRAGADRQRGRWSSTRHRRDTEPTLAPARPHHFNVDGGDFYQRHDDDHRDDVVEPAPPVSAGLGTSTGRTTYVYSDLVRRVDSVYQVSVYNLHPSAEASFNIRAELLTGSKRPALPPDPQVRVKNVTSSQVQVDFLDSVKATSPGGAPGANAANGGEPGKKLKYCAVAQPRTELKPLSVLSSECNIRSRIPTPVLDSLYPPLAPGYGQTGAYGLAPGAKNPDGGQNNPGPGNPVAAGPFPGGLPSSEIRLAGPDAGHGIAGGDRRQQLDSGTGSAIGGRGTGTGGGRTNVGGGGPGVGGGGPSVGGGGPGVGGGGPGVGGGRGAGSFDGGSVVGGGEKAGVLDPKRPQQRLPGKASPFDQPASGPDSRQQPPSTGKPVGSPGNPWQPANSKQGGTAGDGGSNHEGIVTSPDASNPFVERSPGTQNPFSQRNPKKPDFFPSSINEVVVRPVPNPFDSSPSTKSQSPFSQSSAGGEQTGGFLFGEGGGTLSVQSMRMTCGESTRPLLGNLSSGTEYAVEVLALDPETLAAVAYTSALFRTDDDPAGHSSGGPRLVLFTTGSSLIGSMLSAAVATLFTILVVQFV
ncbi:uncharacterized protein LOC135828871 [Sycon ciliatum]|uniref:uncharacterized protein LOC135828871 n=1 Tax=Sycon ciliatum TaxID=27933 RepID=UPI0031F6BFC3